jgi:hypothetical protein
MYPIHFEAGKMIVDAEMGEINKRQLHETTLKGNQ